MNPAGGAKLGYSARAGVARREARPVGTGKVVGSTPTIGSTSSFTSRIDVPPDEAVRAGRLGLSAPLGRGSHRSGALSPSRPSHFFVLTLRPCGTSQRALQPGRPGRDVVGYRLGIEDFGPKQVRILRSYGTHSSGFRQSALVARIVIGEDRGACDGPETVGYLLPQTTAHGQDFGRHFDRETEEVRAGGIRVIWTQLWQVRLLLFGYAGHSSAAEH